MELEEVWPVRTLNRKYVRELTQELDRLFGLGLDIFYHNLFLRAIDSGDINNLYNIVGKYYKRTFKVQQQQYDLIEDFIMYLCETYDDPSEMLFRPSYSEEMAILEQNDIDNFEMTKSIRRFLCYLLVNKNNYIHENKILQDIKGAQDYNESYIKYWISVIRKMLKAHTIVHIEILNTNKQYGIFDVEA